MQKLGRGDEVGCLWSREAFRERTISYIAYVKMGFDELVEVKSGSPWLKEGLNPGLWYGKAPVSAWWIDSL